MPKANKVPKWFWPVGIAAAIALGLYLRNRSSSSSSSQAQSQATPVNTTPPVAYTGYGAYPDTNVPYYDYYGSSPYGTSSLQTNLGLPSNFDPTSFEAGISFAQSQNSPDLGTTTPATTAPVPSTNGGTSPVNVELTVNYPSKPQSGKPKVSGRRTPPHHHTKKKHHGK